MAETPWRRGNRTLQVDASVEHAESSTVPGGAPSAGFGKFWVRDDSPNVPVFTDDTGADHVLGAGGSSSVPGQTGLQYEDALFYADTLNAGSVTTDSAWTEIISGTEASAGTGITLVEGYWDFAFSGNFNFGDLTDMTDAWSGGGTLCMWLNITGTGTNFGGHIIRKSDGSSDGWIVAVSNGASQVQFFVYFSGGLAQWAVTHSLGVPTDYFHLAIVYDSDAPANDPVFYINGVVATLATDINSSGTYDSDTGEDLLVGGGPSGNFFDGDMRGAWFYGNAFTVDQVEAHYRVTATPFIAVATPLSSILEIGNTTDGTDIVISSGDEIRSGDQTSGGNTDSFTVRVGDVSGGFGNSGDLTLRGGDTSTSGGSGGDVTLRGGSAGSGPSGDIFIQGGDPTDSGSGSPGRLVMRAGDRDGSNNNGIGVVAGLKAGNSLNNNGGNLFLRSGAPDAASTNGTTGEIFISTASTNAGSGDPFGNFELNSRTGSITLSTQTQNQADVSVSGNISFLIGSVYATTGNNPGDFTFTGGDIINTNNFTSGTGMDITLGDGTATIGGGGGSFTVTAGNNTRVASATNDTGVAGGIFLSAGTSTLTGAAAFGGPVEISAGDGVGTDTAGGSVEITAGAGTGARLGGSIVLTAGLGASSANHGRTVISQSVGNESEVLELDSTGGTNGWIVDMYVSTVQPNSAVTGNAGDVCFVSTGPGTAGEMWIKESGSSTNTGWAQVTTGGGISDLQSAYEGGNTIATNSTFGDFDVSGTEAITLASSGSDVTLETTDTTVPGNIILSAGGATAGPGGDITLTGGNVTAGAGGVGGAITATAGDSFGAFDGGAATFTAGQGGATNDGGDALLQGGAGGATSGDGGRADVFAGNATTDGAGGVAALLGGTAAGNNNGGAAGATGGTGSGSGNGGAAVLVGGTAGATGDGGSSSVTGADGGATSGDGGVVQLVAGSGGGAGDGGLVQIAGGNATGTSNSGGLVSITAGDSTDSDSGGLVLIQAGDSETGTGGAAGLQAGNATDSSTGNGGSAVVEGGDGPEGGGNASLVGGDGTDTGDGGTVFLLGGDASTAGNGGDIEITGGDGAGSLGLGGSLALSAGVTSGTNSAGQDVTLTAGDGNGTGDGGNIVLNPGSATGSGTDGEVTINGKLTVTGLIDPTGLVLDEQSSVPFATTAGMATLWVRDDTPNTLVFTDDAGNERDIINEQRDIWYGWVDQQDTTQSYLLRSGTDSVASSAGNGTGFMALADIVEHYISFKPTATGSFNSNLIVRVYRNGVLAFGNLVAVNTATLAVATRDIVTANISAGDRFDISVEPQATGAGTFLVTMRTTYDWSTVV